jgi:L-fucose mutarotase
MLLGIDPLLSGEVLLHLDRMGHSDLVVVADAHFPAYRVGGTVLEIAGTSPRVVQAVTSVLRLDDVDPVSLMDAEQPLLAVQSELLAAAGVAPEAATLVERFAFYEVAARASLIIRTTETRIYANAILSKGVTPEYPPRVPAAV